jgi:hypothetical protein
VFLLTATKKPQHVVAAVVVVVTVVAMRRRCMTPAHEAARSGAKRKTQPSSAAMCVTGAD